MQFPRCDLYPAEAGFYCQCAGCPVVSNDTAACVLTEMSDGTYHFNGLTPHGGIKAVITFTNDDGQSVPKPEAKHVEIREFDSNGALVGVQFGLVDPKGFYMQ